MMMERGGAGKPRTGSSNALRVLAFGLATTVVALGAWVSVAVPSAAEQGYTQINLVVPGSSAPEIGVLSRALSVAMARKGIRVTLEDVASIGEGTAILTRRRPGDRLKMLILDDAQFAAMNLRGDAQSAQLIPVGLLASSPWTVLVRDDIGTKSISELKGKTLAYGVGPGAAMSLFRHEVPAIDMLPFKVYGNEREWNAALKRKAPAVIGAPLSVAVTNVLLKETYKPLAVATLDRLPAFGWLPSFGEQGIRTRYASVYAIVTSGDMAEETVRKLGVEIGGAATDTREFAMAITNAGFLPFLKDGAEARRFLLAREMYYARALNPVNPFAGTLTVISKGRETFVQFRLAVRATVRILIYRISSLQAARARELGTLLPTKAPHEFNVSRETWGPGKYHIAVYGRSEAGSVDYLLNIEVELK